MYCKYIKFCSWSWYFADNGAIYFLLPHYEDCTLLALKFSKTAQTYIELVSITLIHSYKEAFWLIKGNKGEIQLQRNLYIPCILIRHFTVHLRVLRDPFTLNSVAADQTVQSDLELLYMSWMSVSKNQLI